MKTALHRTRSQHGFSLLEMMVTLAIAAIVGGMATASMIRARRAYMGDGAMRIVMTQFNRARELSITQRRLMEVKFVGTNWVQIVRHETDGITTTVLSSMALENNVQFALTGGVPDTPDAFGAGAAIAFGVGALIQFNTDGTLIDANGLTLNGTVFLNITNLSDSTRAVTVMGTTGRVRGYKWVADKNNANGAWVRV
jgi:prepilin-type N-terminal cleavage/methylation domain-containing protein